MNASVAERRGDKFSQKSKPTVIKRGSVRVVIYRVKNGKNYTRFSVAFREANGERRLRHFSDPDEAKREAEIIATRLANGQTDVTKLRNADVAELLSVRQRLDPLKLSVTQAVTEFAAATERLPKGSTLLEAVNYFAKRHPSNMPRKTVNEVVEEFLTDRASAGLSLIHLRDLTYRLQRFAKAFEMPIAEVTGAMVQKFITTLKHQGTGKPSAARSKENALRQIVSVFNYARRMKYVTSDAAFEISEVQAPKQVHTEIGIYTPEEITRLFSAADSEILPALAIASFAGLRLAEVARLDWKEVRLSERLIVVEAAKSKTAARRLVPISDNLHAWLTTFAKPTGGINPCQEDPLGNALGDRFGRAAARANVTWVRNGFRHSYITYRVAVLKDVAATALECGNSPTVIFSNYRALATAAEAAAWFSVLPAAANKKGG